MTYSAFPCGSAAPPLAHLGLHAALCLSRDIEPGIPGAQQSEYGKHEPQVFRLRILDKNLFESETKE